jgi:hypothetical protein
VSPFPFTTLKGESSGNRRERESSPTIIQIPVKFPDLAASTRARFRRTHEFPEWKKNFLPNTSTPIPWEEALEAQGRADMIEAVEKQDQLERSLDTVFGA